MKKSIIKIVLSILLLIIALIIEHYNLLFANILFLINYILIGGNVILTAIKKFFHKQIFNENLLMSVATIGAIIIGEYKEAIAVMLLYQIGELFQTYAVNKSRLSIAKLMNIKPKYANLKINSEIKKVNPNQLKINDLIVIKPGERIPVDSIIIEGKTMIDTSSLTGESVPRAFSVNDQILSGSININSMIVAKVVKLYNDSTVAKILELVENASSKKAQTEKFITKFSKYYTPMVIILACMLAFIPPLLTDTKLSEWIYRALIFLVISCPCALVISVPLGFFGGIGGLSRNGILVKGGSVIENLAQTKAVAFDKTGTLTKGTFEVINIHSKSISKDNLIKYAAYAETYSNHPIALSIKNSYNKKIDTKLINEVDELGGYGIKAVIDGKTVLVGNDKLMNKNNIDYTKATDIGTTIYVAVDNNYMGYIIIGDQIKEESKTSINKLKNIKITNLSILTGDSNIIANEVAKKLGIPNVYSEMLPLDKVNVIEKIMSNKKDKEKIVFVGDGINDAPVLIRSDVGIAMGGLGSDVAIEAADVVIMNDDPTKIVDAIIASKKTIRIVKQNIIFSLSIKFFIMILATFGIATMLEGIFADVGVSIIAILNSIRTLKL